MRANNPFRLLHLSDLHLDAKNSFDQSVVLNPLIDCIITDQEAGLKPEIIVVTGDIAKTGRSSEYEAAKLFFDKLCRQTGVPDENLFIVPGNHDLNHRKLPKELCQYENMQELNTELKEPEIRTELLKRMRGYFAFIAKNYPHLKSQYQNLIPFVQRFPAACGKTIGLIGLNSAWMCRTGKNVTDQGRIAIGEYQLIKAMQLLDQCGSTDLNLVLLHHPINFLWAADRSLSKQYLNDCVLLCGHLHDAEGFSKEEDYDCRSFCFQAGATYLGSASDWPARYQYITFDWQSDSLSLDFRRFDEERHRWILDSQIGDNGCKCFDLFRPTSSPQKSTLKKRIARANRFTAYLQHLGNEHRHLPLQGFETTFRQPIELENVYINMRAHVQTRSFDDYNMVEKKRMAARNREEQLTSLDIKGAFAVLRQHKIKDMVILGDPGSGKTTLLNYILLMLADGKANETMGLPPDIIPFLAPLREWKIKDREQFIPFIRRIGRLDHFKIKNQVLKELFQAGRGVILLDGLDEVADEKTRTRVCRLIDHVRKSPIMTHTSFVITSRFSGYLGASRLNGNILELSVQDFTHAEMCNFLKSWFATVETVLHPGSDAESWRAKGREDAERLIKRIEQAPHIQNLAVNPLMLQIIALVHRDCGAMPQRRVELYDECTNVLLEKWDMAKGLETLLTARQARQVLQPLALWLHQKDQRRSAPLDVIAVIVKKALAKMGQNQIDADTLLRNIRDRSGVFMGYSATEYGFTHLSFQEYLAAEQIRNLNKIQLLVEKYGQKWWREVTLLCLALDNPSIIEPFMERIIPTPHFKTDINLILDAVDDSITKPITPFCQALQQKRVSREAKSNAIRVLKRTGGDEAVKALRRMVKAKDKKLALMAFEGLEQLDAVNGLTRPVADAQPKRIISKKDQAEMVLIPAGPFLYGSREDDQMADSDEKPQRVIELPAFYMDKYPVTKRQYALFLNEIAPDDAKLEKWIDLTDSSCRIKQIKERYQIEKGYVNHPVTYVTWYGAKAYAQWAEKQLPTEQQWEKAARGKDGAIYPWGDKFDSDRCNSDESKIGGTSDVNQFPQGQSPYGCYDMVGNVWEWTDSYYKEDEKLPVLRGGGWNDGRVGTRCAVRDRFNPYFRVNDVGFRCSRTST